MARRRITAEDGAEILVHCRAGRRIRQIARSLGYGRNTVRERIAEATAAGFGRESPPWTAAEWRGAGRGPSERPPDAPGGSDDAFWKPCRIARSYRSLQCLPRRSEQREQMAIESDVSRGLPGDQLETEQKHDRVGGRAARQHEVRFINAPPTAAMTTNAPWMRAIPTVVSPNADEPSRYRDEFLPCALIASLFRTSVRTTFRVFRSFDVPGRGDDVL